MSRAELEHEIASGVEFWGYEADGDLLGAMGIQRVRDVHLIRHAYVRPGNQGRGVGSQLLAHLQASMDDTGSPDRDLGRSSQAAVRRRFSLTD